MLPLYGDGNNVFFYSPNIAINDFLTFLERPKVHLSAKITCENSILTHFPNLTVRPTGIDTDLTLIYTSFVQVYAGTHKCIAKIWIYVDFSIVSLL